VIVARILVCKVLSWATVIFAEPDVPVGEGVPEGLGPEGAPEGVLGLSKFVKNARSSGVTIIGFVEGF
jgi:hypothetical protein